MSSPIEGFWQVIDDDKEERIIPYSALYTTLSLRAAGFSIYAGGYFLQIRTATGRRPPAGWPASRAERIGYFRTSEVVGGSYSWHETASGGTIEHRVSITADPRLRNSTFQCALDYHGDFGRVQIARRDGRRTEEAWRRLSGVGSSTLAGAWESRTANDYWMYLVTAGHYGVVNEKLDRPAVPHANALSDDETFTLADTFGSNAGARLEGTTSFDHWPMVSSNQAGFEARKHETFRLQSVEKDRLVISLAADGPDASEWKRIG